MSDLPTQEWVTKMTSESDSFLGANGPTETPLPTAKEEWMAKYVLRMVERGIDAEDAWACCRAGESDHDYTNDPADTADDEMSYWDDDGDAA